MSYEISVVIPLYNKGGEIGDTLLSVLGQSVLPCEIIVVDDGSTDGGVEVVRSFDSPLIRLVQQSNSGVSAARNLGANEARGTHIALLDADDRWEPDFLLTVGKMIETYPQCGVYSTAFWAVNKKGKNKVQTLQTEGPIDFFCEGIGAGVPVWTSATVVSRSAWAQAGGFPEGMKIGEDLYFWIRLADISQVCYTPQRLSNYVLTASNRSAKNYTPEQTTHSFQELYQAEEGNSCRNEYIARCALGKAITLSAKGDTEFGRQSAQFFSYTTKFRRQLHRLRILNSLPKSLRPLANNTYNKLAWLFVRKGF